MQLCLLRGDADFPITERSVLERITAFSDTATYYNYTMRLQEVCFFLGTSSAWLTPAVRHVAKGLKNDRTRA